MKKLIIIFFYILLLSCTSQNNELYLKLNENNQIFTKKSKIEISQLYEITKEYYSLNKSHSSIVLTISDESSVGNVLEIKEVVLKVVNSLREALSTENYAKRLEDLNSKEKKVVEKTYPLKIKIIRTK